VTSSPPYWILAAVTALAYLIGGLPFGYWFVRLSAGKDIRKMGSGNIGATNVHRSFGRKAGVVVLLLDICKGFIAVRLAAELTNGASQALGLAAVAVMLGHCYPVLLRFKGGKAVACFVGAFLYITPLALAISAVVFFAVVKFSKYISLGSIFGAISFPFAVWLSNRSPRFILAASILAALLIVYRHRTNISRLRSGREHAFSLKGGSAE